MLALIPCALSLQVLRGAAAGKGLHSNLARDPALTGLIPFLGLCFLLLLGVDSYKSAEELPNFFFGNPYHNTVFRREQTQLMLGRRKSIFCSTEHGCFPSVSFCSNEHH